MSDKVRQRKVNWSPAEISVLLEEVRLNYAGLFGQYSDLTAAEKKNKWEAIANKISASGKVTRDVADVKKKWVDMKCVTRKKANLKMIDKKLSGEEQDAVSGLTELESRIVSMIPPESESKSGHMSYPCSSSSPDRKLLHPQPRPISATLTSLDSNMGHPAKKTKTSIANREFEQQKLNVQKELLEVEKQRLEIEKQRFEVEKEILIHLKKQNSDFAWLLYQS